MGQKNSIELTETDTESLKSNILTPFIGASVATFFGVVESKDGDDQNLDSSDSDITIDDSASRNSPTKRIRKGKKNSKTNRKNTDNEKSKLNKPSEKETKTHAGGHAPTDFKKSEKESRDVNFIKEPDTINKDLKKEAASNDQKKLSPEIENTKKVEYIKEPEDPKKLEATKTEEAPKKEETQKQEVVNRAESSTEKRKENFVSNTPVLQSGVAENFNKSSPDDNKVKTFIKFDIADTKDNHSGVNYCSEETSCNFDDITDNSHGFEKCPQCKKYKSKEPKCASQKKSCLVKEGMHEYQQYSREPAERDQDLTCCKVQHDMNCCCQNCCIAANNNQYIKSAPRIKKPYCRTGSEPFVCYGNNCSKRENGNANPSQSKSAPNNAPKPKVYSPVCLAQSDKRSSIPQPPPPPASFQESPIFQRKNYNSRNRSLERHHSRSPSQSPPRNNQNMYNLHNYNYEKQPYRHVYPYEEPTDTTSYTRDNECNRNCSGYEHCPEHRICRCRCLCELDYCRRNLSDDQISCCSESTKADFMNLAYQRTGDYPELVDELENTLSQRNRMRVQKTMQQFEILSRQNKNLEKPIFDDEESLRNYNSGCQRHRYGHHSSSNECKCCNCKSNEYNESNRNNVISAMDKFNAFRGDANLKYQNCSSSTFPRKSGYVEKVARCMDPNLNDKILKRQKQANLTQFAKKQIPNPNINNEDKGTWQMDSRKGEWVKVAPGQKQYDFENNYPPLPPRPRSGQIYNRQNRQDYCDSQTPCMCSKCSKNNR